MRSNVRLTSGQSSFESSLCNSLGIVAQPLLASTLYAHSSKPVDDVAESFVDDDVPLDSGDTHDLGTRLLSKLHLMYLTLISLVYSWATLGMIVPFVLLGFSVREGGLTLAQLKTIRGSEHLWDLFIVIKGLCRITASSCDLSFLWSYDLLSLLRAGLCQLEKEMIFDSDDDPCRFRGDLCLWDHKIKMCPVTMASFSLERFLLRFTTSVIHMNRFCGGTWMPWSLFDLVRLQFGFNRWTTIVGNHLCSFRRVSALRRSVSVAALGATLVTHAHGTKLATSLIDSVFYGRLASTVRSRADAAI
jgi:hypothetical protein